MWESTPRTRVDSRKNIAAIVYMVGLAGLEPAMPYGPDLQSGAVPITLY